jgi:RNA polymerase-binding transcription factor DksA
MTENVDFEAILRARKSELEQRLRKIEDELDEPASSDTSERAIGIEDNEIRQGVGQAGLAELKAVNAAIGRIGDGTFGICLRCGGPISTARLKAVPHAAICEDCIKSG